MKIQTFIEKAIEGGWKKDTFGQLKFGNYWGNQISLTYTREDGERGEWLYNYWAILLDPEAWKAVGKVEGWRRYDSTIITTHRDPQNKHLNRHTKIPMKFSWKWYMHRMIDALAEGRTIEQYLENI